MNQDTQRNLLAELLQGRSEFPEPAGDTLKRLRARALERANALSVPSVRDEEWRFTDLAPLYKGSYRPVAAAAGIDAARLAGATMPEADVRLVFCDGHLVSALPTDLPRGLSLAAGGDELGSIADFEQDAFVALNTSYLKDAAVIRAGRDAVATVHVVHVAQSAQTASYPRVFVQAAGGARVTVVEEFVGSDSDALVNAVTEIDVAAAGEVRHVKLQRQSAAQFHIGQLSARVARDGILATHCVTLGARLSRHNVHIVQAGEGVHCRLDGLAVLAGRQHADTHTAMDHALPHGNSEQVHKCIVDDTARAVFNGKILVRKDAQLTNAAQQSRNLLLSARARVDTKPQLEIFADDVKCAHGATVGQLEAEELFYLRSRGLTPDAARALLTYAFAAEVIERIPVPSLAQRLREEVLARTNRGSRP